MAIADEITRLQNAKSDLKTSINAKTDDQHKITNELIDDYSTFVDSIQTGGGADLSEYFNTTPSAEDLATPTNWVANNYIKKVGELIIPDTITSLQSLCAISTATKGIKFCPKVICGNNITNMKYMYQGMEVESIDVSGLDTSNVTNINCMFDGIKLKEIDISSFDLRKLKTSYDDARRLFSNCFLLEKVILPVQMVDIIDTWFPSCYSLKTLIISKNDVICRYMNTFQNCYHMNGTVNATYNPQGIKDGRIYVPDNLVDSYKSASGWSTYADQILPLSQYTE